MAEELPGWIRGDPWDRQRDEAGELEPSLWYERFWSDYRPLGPERSILAAYNHWRSSVKGRGAATGAPMSWIGAAREWAWQERAEAWDAEQRRLRLVMEDAQRRAMLDRHVNVGMALQSKATAALRALDSEDMSPADIRLYFTDGVKLERQARGLPEFLVAVAQMTDEELLAEWERLLREGVGGDFGEAGEGEGGG